MKFCKDCWNEGRCKAQGKTVNFPVDDGVCLEFDEVKNMTNADRIRAMTDEELADFFFESPEIEFEVCEYCEYFGGHTSDTPCKHDMGRCFIPSKNEAFKKWLQQPCEED